MRRYHRTDVLVVVFVLLLSTAGCKVSSDVRALPEQTAPTPSATMPVATPTPTATVTPSPIPTATPTPIPPSISVRVDPPAPAQGETTVVWVSTDRPAMITGSFDGVALTFIPYSPTQAWALVPVAPWHTVGSRPLLVYAESEENGGRGYAVVPIDVQSAEFAEQSLQVPADRANLLDPEILAAEREMLRPIFGTVTPRRLWNQVFGMPTEGITTTTFAARRMYENGQVQSYHGGIDIAAEEGTPVYAPADGTVVFSDDVQVRGKLIIIDHGAGLHSAYFHLSQRDVARGDVVSAGDKIGEIGNTGFSTGAHLHWEMRIYNVTVDPAQWIRIEWNLPNP